MAAPKRTVRWGILSTARIAAKVSRAIHQADGAEAVAVASRNKVRAEAWAREHEVPTSYGSYDAMLDDPGLDAIYVAVPPSMHAEWTIRAAEKGKHVLCEKPLARNAAEARQMAEACRSSGVQLMDGVMWAHHERTAAMKRHVTDGSLGKLRRVIGSFTFNWDEIPEDNIRLSRELAGGCLGDLGWYCVGAILWAFDTMPTRAFATARYYRDVEVNLSGLLWFDGDRMASFDCGFDTAMRKWFEVAGTAGSLVCDDFTLPRDEGRARYWLHDADGKAQQHTVAGRAQEVRMIEDFSAIVRSGTLDDRWPAQSIRVQQVCDALSESARHGEVIELAD
jgi:predicted dehydrogenase